MFVALVRAGEESGQLAEVLRNLTDNLKWQDEIAAQTRTILLYPAVTAVIVIGAIVVLLKFVVPNLVQVIATLQPTLSTQTKVLIAVSKFVSNYWYLILVAPILLVGGFKYAVNKDARLRFG